MNDKAIANIEQARRYAVQLGNLVRPGGVYGPVLAGLLDCLAHAHAELVKAEDKPIPAGWDHI